MHLTNIIWKMERGQTTTYDARDMRQYVEELERKVRELEQELERAHQQVRDARRGREAQW